MSFTPSREQVERLLTGLDSISMGLDEVRAVLSESANARAREPVVDYLKRNTALRSNGFEVSLSRDGKFINRKKS